MTEKDAHMTYLTQTRPLLAAIAGRADDLIKTLRQRRENYLTYRQTSGELHALSDRELADIGISRCDIPRVVRENI